MSESSEPIYLDYAATTPIDPRVLEAMMPYLTDKFGNASSRDHAFGWDARDAVELARYHVANLINATPNEIVFTSGATESINMALKGLAFENRIGKRRIVTTAVEHSAVLETCRQLERMGLAEIDTIPVDSLGRIDLDRVAAMISPDQTLLVAVMHANNETGNIYPIREIAELAYARGALFFTDASQTVGKISVDVRAEAIDLMALSAHKIYGPKGVGALFIRGGDAKCDLTPLLSGGGQERGQRSGTHNVAAIVGFGEACQLAAKELANDASRTGLIRDEIERELCFCIPGVTINGDANNRLPTFSNLQISGVIARDLTRKLRRIAISTRSACATTSQGPSEVLLAMGLSDEQALSSIRISLGRQVPDETASVVVQSMIEAVSRRV